jgi:MarR family
MPDMTSPDAQVAPDQLVDTVLAASRALAALAVGARSLAAAGDPVTLPQYRALVVLAARGPQGTADLPAALAVNPSTANRMCDRLVRKGLIRRHRQPGDRLGVLPPEEHEPVIAAFRAFAAAAGEVRRARECPALARAGPAPPRAALIRSYPGRSCWPSPRASTVTARRTQGSGPVSLRRGASRGPMACPSSSTLSG